MARTARIPLLAILLLGIALLAIAGDDDIARMRNCELCGMDRKAFGYSRTVVVKNDGSEVGLCSIHCAADVALKLGAESVKSILVADRNTGRLLEASKAFWTLGGSKRGVMTRYPKWAFASREEAGAFTEKHGGKEITFDEALKAATGELER